MWKIEKFEKVKIFGFFVDFQCKNVEKQAKIKNFFRARYAARAGPIPSMDDECIFYRPQDVDINYATMKRKIRLGVDACW